MIRWAAWMGALALSTVRAAAAEVVLDVLVDGAPAGTARLNQALQSDGTKRVVMTVTTGAPGAEITARLESVYASDGTPVRRLSRTEDRAGGVRQTVATFGSEGASWSVDGAPPQARPWPRAGFRRASSEFWFIRTQPSPGTVAAHDHFDLARGVWERMEVSYVGPVRIAWNGGTVAGHRLRVRRGGVAAEAVVDDAGLPYTLSEGRMRMVRRAAEAGR